MARSDGKTGVFVYRRDGIRLTAMAFWLRIRSIQVGWTEVSSPERASWRAGLLGQEGNHNPV